MVLLITDFYSFVLVRETASAYIGGYKFQSEFFQISKAAQIWESPTRRQIEKKKLQKSSFFSNDFINAILNYFWLVSPQSIVDFRVKVLRSFLPRQHDKVLRGSVVQNRPLRLRSS